MSGDKERSNRPAWVLDELASAGRENMDLSHVQAYDDKMDSQAADEVDLLKSFGLGASSVVVDLGCGTGQFALRAASACSRVVAVDVSPVMLERITAKRDQAAIGNVEVVAGGFLSYDHAGEPADIIYSRYALHHLPDFWKAVALGRIRAMLRPGGILRLWDVVYCFELADADERIEAWCSTYRQGSWARWELEEHVRDEFSTFSWLLEPMIERAGFVIESADYSEDGFDARYVLRTGSAH